MRSKTSEILKEAMTGGYAVGAFNTSNLELTQGIVRAAYNLEKPCIVQITVKSMSFANKDVLGDVVKSVIEHESNSVPIGFHLDHGKTLDDIINAIDVGVDSVMIDASRSNFKENCKTTKQVVEYAHKKGVSVQAELGNVPYLGTEEQNIDWEEVMTDPVQAKELVEKTGIDALAVGIGNAHGFFRERPIPDWDRLRAIRTIVPEIPLILHGASDWKEDAVKRAIVEGISCFNIDTDVRIAFIGAICTMTRERCDVTDPRKMMANVRENVVNKVEEKIQMFNSQ